ncbi:sensor domain-containing protein [Cohnella fermenti]|uniref:EAL domain-containing protein n=1 Tax=Cohnella fermenti TaxID=2565925 RepID=A0A4S4C6Y6_9BACL|nr:GGDEF domain-containing phosphodiesterase [Cohnella fermenti]THF83698.1 EAL domain-containing protein [Cohnella fermenti]
MNGWSDRTSYRLELLNSIYNSPITIAVLSVEGHLLDLNQDLSEFFGYSRAEMIGEKFSRWLDPSYYDDGVQAMRSALRGECVSQDIRVVHKSGYPVDLNVTLSPMRQGDGIQGVVLVMQDVTQHKRSLKRNHYLAHYDDMTGLPNRRLFLQYLEDKLREANERGGTLAVCYVDVDRFKLVNASFGRDTGDMLLLLIAARLSEFFRGEGDLARMEGDEFAGILPDIRDEEDLANRMAALLAVFDEPFLLGESPIQVSVSIGIMTSDGAGEDAPLLLKKADTALNKAKENGRNDYHLYSEDIDQQAYHRLTLQHELMKALQNGEFLLHYQPQYDLATGRIVGTEALVRWLHPTRGLVPPGEFIPAAEDSGLIVPLGDWVLEEACRQNKEWQDAGAAPIPVSVNLSVRQFSQRNLIGKIGRVLKATGLDPKCLKLEITESVTMDVERATLFLEQLAELGVGISIDDFGTGYSSFHYLRNFPIGSLKIDRSFVRDIEQDPNDAAIVAAIIAMAHNLRLQVIAEGVETLEQVRFLRSHGCDEMQGYYGSPPLPKAGIESLLFEATSFSC